MKRMQEILRVVNNKEKHITYYQHDPSTNKLTRISREAYDSARDTADDFSCLLTKTTGDFTRHYTTCLYNN